MGDPLRLATLLDEQREFPPSEAFRGAAHCSSDAIYHEAGASPETFWAGWARQLEWVRPLDRVLEWTPPHAQWFLGGRINASVNCVDRHLKTWRRNKAALIWEGEPGDRRTLTYRDLYREVNQFANVLKHLGVKRGDRVAIYMPMVPEVAVAMLACSRIGAPHSVVFRRLAGGVGDEAFVHMQEGRDHWWHRLMQDAPPFCEPEPMESEDLLFILYTSGTTGKPKGIVHTTGGYLTHVAATTRLVFDLKDEDVFWCTADVGWVTGHSYVVYGPLALGATQVMYEGAPDWPDKDRFWDIVATYGVTILYTAPTAIRAFMKWGTEYPARHDLSSLRLLGTVGEPINPEAWIWYHHNIGGQRCPIVDTWWQTETGGIMITPLPGVVPTKPGSATRAFPGISATVLDGQGKEIAVGGGFLALTGPWPGMARTIWGDDERFRTTYWSRWQNIYFAGDGAKRDADGYFWLLGRVDDVLNVAGHRIGTMEVESALVDHPAVAEAAVVGKHHDLKGQAIAAFVTLKTGHRAADELKDELKAHVVEKIGALARPDDILFSADLPKTRSGKIMRRLLRDIAEGRALGDTTTLADPGVVAKLKEQYEEKES